MKKRAGPFVLATLALVLTASRSAPQGTDSNGGGNALRGAVQGVVLPPAQPTRFNTALDFHDGRFRVEVEWQDFEERQGAGTAVTVADGEDVPLRSSDSTVVQFFGNNNWELLLKVLDGRPIKTVSRRQALGHLLA